MIQLLSFIILLIVLKYVIYNTYKTLLILQTYLLT